MITPWRLWATIIGIILIFAGGLALGYRLFRPAEQKTTVTAQLILTALRDRGFLVTQTYVFDEPVMIKKTSGSSLEDFFFGQTITARGVMEANVGIDLAKLTAEDITVNSTSVEIRIPTVSLFNVRPLGPIEVKNDRGLLKRLLEEDSGYNEALAELTRQAEASAVKPELMERATEHAKEEIVQLLGLVVQGRKVVVDIK